MLEILNIGFIIFLYGCIWFVPIGINSNRRKQGKAPYWIYFSVALALEMTVLYLVLFGAKALQIGMVGLYLAPFVAAAIAGWYYVSALSKADERHI